MNYNPIPGGRSNQPLEIDCEYKNGPRGPAVIIDSLFPVTYGRAEKAMEEMPDIMQEITDEQQETVMSLREAMDTIASAAGALKPTKKALVEELRSMRMTSAAEVAATLKPLEDLRKFFLGSEHEKEIARLREFVELCERLEKLKASGFLDTVADTLLKLA